MWKARRLAVVVIFFALVTFVCWMSNSTIKAEEKTDGGIKSDYVGSSECRRCHERFYQLWAPSHHGLAMQPYTPDFASKNLTPQKDDIVIGKVSYRAEIGPQEGYVIEKGPGDHLEKYPILHVLGGKNVYYFLTELERGKLQVLPAAYDLNRKAWFDTAASGVRHFPDRDDDSPFHWKDRPYTFNTSCYGCHVSQLVKNYDLETDSYHTQWKEPGINCETCHGPAEEHVRIYTEAEAQGATVDDPKLVTVTQSRGFTAEQVNAACLTCHAKAAVLSAEFVPGDEFFQHYDLVTLEHPDFYPDGRDLGENYTMDTWRMSPCVKAGKLDCMYCHTSSGRYRFKGENANQACLPCHQDKTDIRAHSHHKPKSGVTECVVCHMPKTEFGRMIRSDHSMRPPMPAASAKYKSPNACNICHKNKTPEWADSRVRRWHKDDYQEKPLKLAGWLDKARRGQWDDLSEILTWLQSDQRDEIYANSYVRLLHTCSNKAKWPVLIKLLQDDPSPLIRASAADALLDYINDESIPVLARATSDPYRLVRVRAAATLAVLPNDSIPMNDRQAYLKAVEEYKSSLLSRPDDAVMHYNMGNFYMNQRDPSMAIKSFETSWKLQEDHVPAYVNASMAYNSLGQNHKALESLQKALTYDPNSTAANLNTALLYGEMGQYSEAEKYFKTTFKLNPKSAVAAYNLGVLMAHKDPVQSIAWCQKASKLEPNNEKYAYTLAYYYYQAGRLDEAISLLHSFVARNTTTDINIYLLLGGIYERMGNAQGAVAVYQSAINNPSFDQRTKDAFSQHLQRLIEQP